jgi:hypothetical protein
MVKLVMDERSVDGGGIKANRKTSTAWWGHKLRPVLESPKINTTTNGATRNGVQTTIVSRLQTSVFQDNLAVIDTVESEASAIRWPLHIEHSWIQELCMHYALRKRRSRASKVILIQSR